MSKPFETLSPEAKEIISLFEDIREAGDYMPDRAEEFYDSVFDKARDIAGWAEIDSVTPAQLNAMKNMHKGVMKWVK